MAQHEDERDARTRGKTPGYSGTPLAKKLGLKEGSRVATIAAPEGYARLLEPLPAGVSLTQRPGPNSDIVHLFVTRRENLAEQLIRLRSLLKSDAALWVSWPKKAARIPTTLTEDTVRELALPLGWVDIKVCAVDEIWSGLKLVVRKALRGAREGSSQGTTKDQAFVLPASKPSTKIGPES